MMPEASADVFAIGIDTTASTPIAVNEYGISLALLPDFKGNPNAQFILWKDRTAIEEAEEINALCHNWGGINFAKYSSGIYSSEWFWAKILHIAREDKKVKNAAYSWVEHCDWIPAILSGQTNPKTIKRSRCIARYKAMWHKEWGGLPSAEFLNKLDPYLKDVRLRLYDTTYTCDISVGTLCQEWAERLNLNESVVISKRALDAHAGVPITINKSLNLFY
jgi:L-ribulokinase